jgi:hypothetical protein
MMKRVIIFITLLGLPLSALAGTWGDPWGTMIWSATGASNAIPVPMDGAWMLIAAALSIFLIGALRSRKR